VNELSGNQMTVVLAAERSRELCGGRVEPEPPPEPEPPMSDEDKARAVQAARAARPVRPIKFGGS
jgi:hypothetical protein